MTVKWMKLLSYLLFIKLVNILQWPSNVAIMCWSYVSDIHRCFRKWSILKKPWNIMTAFRFSFLCFFNIQIETIAGIIAIYESYNMIIPNTAIFYFLKLSWKNNNKQLYHNQDKANSCFFVFSRRPSNKVFNFLWFALIIVTVFSQPIVFHKIS